MKFWFTIFLVVAVGCSEKKIAVSCEDARENVDKDFCKTFRDAMLNFQMDDSTAMDNRTYSMLFLEAVTGIQSQANDLHHPFYDSQEQLQEDLVKWNEWFERNKMNWTKRKADSVVLIFSGGKLTL